jgi:site-specific recombinase XerD
VRSLELLEPTGIGLLGAVTAFLEDHRQRSASMTLGAMVEAYSERPGYSEDYAASLRQTRAKVEELLDRPAVEVTASELERVLKDCSPSVRNLRINRLRSIFRYAERKGWIDENPAMRLDFHKIAKQEVRIYHSADVERLLRDAMENDPQLVPFLAICAFTGLRPESGRHIT